MEDCGRELATVQRPTRFRLGERYSSERQIRPLANKLSVIRQDTQEMLALPRKRSGL